LPHNHIGRKGKGLSEVERTVLGRVSRVLKKDSIIRVNSRLKGPNKGKGKKGMGHGKRSNSA